MPEQKINTGGSQILNATEILKEILKIKSGKTVADLGAGIAAYFTIESAKLVGDGGQVYAIDIVKDILSSIDSKAKMAGLYNIKTVWSNLEMVGAAKIADNSLDFALLVNTLFQSKKQTEMISEAFRLLKKGGKLLIIDWSDTAPAFAPPEELQVNKNVISDAALQLDMKLEQEFKAGPYHFGMIYIKK
tara:strand:+ start:62 stop:628 length:567 start_codon:yes stop_codon:yes gene_type:complete